MSKGTITGLILATIFGFGVGSEIGFFTGSTVAYITFIAHMQFWMVE